MTIPCWIQCPGWLLVMYLFVTQGIPALNYEWGVTMGTQDPPDIVTSVGTAFWYGFCLADLVLYIPLLGIGLYLVRFENEKKNDATTTTTNTESNTDRSNGAVHPQGGPTIMTTGRILLAAALGITAYWPIVCLTAANRARGMEGWYLDDSPFLVVLPIIIAWSIGGLVWLVLSSKNDNNDSCRATVTGKQTIIVGSTTTRTIIEGAATENDPLISA